MIQPNPQHNTNTLFKLCNWVLKDMYEDFIDVLDSSDENLLEDEEDEMASKIVTQPRCSSAETIDYYMGSYDEETTRIKKLCNCIDEDILLGKRASTNKEVVRVSIEDGEDVVFYYPCAFLRGWSEELDTMVQRSTQEVPDTITFSEGNLPNDVLLILLMLHPKAHYVTNEIWWDTCSKPQLYAVMEFASQYSISELMEFAWSVHVLVHDDSLVSANHIDDLVQESFAISQYFYKFKFKNLYFHKKTFCMEFLQDKVNRIVYRSELSYLEMSEEGIKDAMFQSLWDGKKRHIEKNQNARKMYSTAYRKVLTEAVLASDSTYQYIKRQFFIIK